MEDISNLSLLLKASADFASYPGQHNDASVKEFLDQFPLPLLFSALSLKSDVPEVESSLVSCLEMIFRTKYGISHVPEYMDFVCVGLSANSQRVRCLACEAVANFLENDYANGKAAELLTKHGAYPLLIDCLLHGEEQVSISSIRAIVNLSKTLSGIGVIFPTNVDDPTHLKNVIKHSPSLARIRAFSLIAKLFSTPAAASVVNSSGLLDLLVLEVNNSNDVLMTLSTLEILYEIASSPHGSEYLLGTTLLQLLTSLIRNSAESVLRSRSLMICGRLLSSCDMFSMIGETTYEGAELLFSSTFPMVKHVMEAAFKQKNRSNQLGILLSVLRQDPEVRLAAYRVITGLVVRTWCLLEICLKHEIIDIVTDAFSESTKYGMDVRHECCLAITNALATRCDLDDPSLSGIASKVQEAVKRGPYLGKKQAEAQPIVVPAERF
ncbi:unnamed protein product [Victoria cruziana]